MLHFQHQSTGFQEKFVHDDALRFQRATNIAKQARVLLGRKLGQSEQEAVSLGKLLVRADLSDPGDADLHQAMKEVTRKVPAATSATWRLPTSLRWPGPKALTCLPTLNHTTNHDTEKILHALRLLSVLLLFNRRDGRRLGDPL